jgi:hypothetical protein
LPFIVSGSHGQRFSGKGPTEGFGHGLVEAGDERLNTLLQPGVGFETALAQKPAGQDGEPDFDLIQP